MGYDAIHYYITGATTEEGLLEHPNAHSFSVNRVFASGVVEFWDPQDQTWNYSVTGNVEVFLDDTFASGGWVRRLLPGEYARDVPNYDKEKFGA